MKIFNTLCLEIASRCNRKCAFCPVAYYTRPDELMSWDLLVKAAEELASVNYRGRVEFYIYNEPMRTRHYLIQCLALFRQTTKACLMIATNGDYFKSATEIRDLFDKGLNQLLINCYSPGLYQRREAWLTELLTDPTVKRGGVYGVNSWRSKTIEMLDKSDPTTFGSGVFGLVNRAGNIPGFLPAPAQPLTRMCVKPFRLLNINWQGDAMVCCQDYYGDVSYGSLASQSLDDLWNHRVMVAYRQHLIRKDRSLPLCRTCDCHAGAYPGNVDREAVGTAGATPAEVERLYTLGLARRGGKSATAQKETPEG